MEILNNWIVTPKLLFLYLYLQQQLMSPCDDDTTLLLQDCYLLEERERLQEEWRLFQEQKKNFEKERKSFTEAAIRLGLEVLEKWKGIRKGTPMEESIIITLIHTKNCLIHIVCLHLYTEGLFSYCVKHSSGHCSRSFSLKQTKQQTSHFLCVLEYEFSATRWIIFLAASEISRYFWKIYLLIH